MRARRILTPGCPAGTITTDCWRYGFGSLGFDFPITRYSLHLGSPAPELHHFEPFSTYSLPSRRISRSMFFASALARIRSVITKALRISPFSSGISHCCFCASLPYFARTSILPVSGAEQFMASLAMSDLPRSSAMRPYSRLVKATPSL